MKMNEQHVFKIRIQLSQQEYQVEKRRRNLARLAQLINLKPPSVKYVSTQFYVTRSRVHNVASIDQHLYCVQELAGSVSLF